MATDTTLQKRTMLAAFKQKLSPFMFLSSFFRTTSRDIFRSKKAVIDVKRNKEQIAVDVVRGTGGRLNQNKLFTTKEYEPPVYNEYTSYTDEEFNNRLPGDTEYENPEYISDFLAVATDDQVELAEKIQRAIEKQASDVLFTGEIPLINGDTVDFKQKSTHDFNAATVWSDSAAKPLQDIETACILNRKDGFVQSKVAIFGETAWKEFVVLVEASNRFELRRADFGTLKLPTLNAMGAVYMGDIVAGSYVVQCWTYPQFYDVPTAVELGGIVLPNAGTKVPYVPATKVVVMPMRNEIDLRLIYAGIPQIVEKVAPPLRAIGIKGMPRMVRGAFHPYGYTDTKNTAIEIGVKSAPLCVPTQIDGWCVITT